MASIRGELSLGSSGGMAGACIFIVDFSAKKWSEDVR